MIQYIFDLIYFIMFDLIYLIIFSTICLIYAYLSCLFKTNLYIFIILFKIQTRKDKNIDICVSIYHF